MTNWKWCKKTSLVVFLAISIIILWWFVTPMGRSLRIELAKTIITTRYQEYAWIFVGKNKRDQLIEEAKSYAIP